MNETVFSIVFYVLAAITVVAAAAVVWVRNIFHAALFLVLTFVGVAALYITLNADFLAAVQVLIYAGAVAVLLIFAIMLTQNARMGNRSNNQRGPAILISVLVLIAVGWTVWNTVWPAAGEEPTVPTTAPIAQLLFNQYVLPFEVASVLLLVAMIGAIILARED